MTQILASSKLDKFDLKGELDELAPLIKNGLYKKFNFEGALHTEINLSESKILILQNFSSGNANTLISKFCHTEFKDVQNDVNFFKNMSINDAKKYDLIVIDAHVWGVPYQDLEKSIELADNGMPCLLIGNDTNAGVYGDDSEIVNMSNPDLVTSYIDKDVIPFSLNDYKFINLADTGWFPTRLASDKMFPLMKCKQYYSMIAYESPCNTMSVVDYTAGFINNEDFLKKLVQWLISTKRCAVYDNAIQFGDGVICQEPYKNLWERYLNNGRFDKSAIRGNWTHITDFPHGVIDEFNENPRIIRCAPGKGMNYCTIYSRDYLNDFPDSEYPTGTSYRISCWVYAEENCDMAVKYARILGESMTTGGCEGYNFEKKGTWQYMSATITSNAPGFYFLLYANTGYENVWTKGNIYFANIVVSKITINEEKRYVDYDKSATWNKISIDAIDSGKDFTVLYHYKQILNYTGNLSGNTNKEIIYFTNSANKSLRIYDYFVSSQGADSWLGYDEFVTSSAPFWHTHIGIAATRSRGDDAYVILRKSGNEICWYVSRNGQLFKSGIANVSSYPDLLNFNVNKIEIRAGHGGLAKSLTIYKRALSHEEIIKLTNNKKHMSIGLDGNLNTCNLNEKEWIPENCFYTSLSEDSCKNLLKVKEIAYFEDWAFSGNIKNYLGQNLIIPSSNLVKCDYNEAEKEYTIFIPKNDSMQWHEKGVKINWVTVDGNERYVFAFDYYCDRNITMNIDLNNMVSGMSTNDNHENVSRYVYKRKGGYNTFHILYDLNNAQPTFSCFNAIYIDQNEIPPEGLTFKIKNVRLNKIVGGKANNNKNIYYPFTDTDYRQNIKLNLHEDIGLKWNEPWTICYMKIPVSVNTSYSYLIDSLGHGSNTLGGGYIWFGKDYNYDRVTIMGGNNMSYSSSEFLYKQQMCVIQYNNGVITYKVYLENGKKLECHVDSNITTANRYVTQLGYDLTLGGWNNTEMCQAYYKDLIVAQRVLSENELMRIFKARIIDEPNNTNINSLLNEGGI